MKPPNPRPPDGNKDPLRQLFAGLFGAFFGLCLLKFGNPPIMEKWVTTPTNLYEFVLWYPWPISWAYVLLAGITILGLYIARWKTGAPVWLIALPLLWLGWEVIASSQSVDPGLTEVTLKHFAACVVCFYLGLFALSTTCRLAPFWMGLLAGFALVLSSGWQQHFGGLEATRKYFFLYIYPGMRDVPPEFLKKMSSERIFGTLFYPNALAGALLLILPLCLGAIWRARRFFTPAARGFLMGAVGIAAVGCMYWSRSKGGWLLMLLLLAFACLRLEFPKRYKVGLITVLLLGGLVGFFWRYAAFFEKGATSVSARFDYWHAAAHTVSENPVFGTGPGTFYRAYEKVRRAGSEPSRLVHNDYLEQASDSGLPGCLLFTLFIAAALYKARVPMDAKEGRDWLAFWVWLGVLGWALQSFVEFGLYIPALAWLAFALLGWLLNRQLPAVPANLPAKE